MLKKAYLLTAFLRLYTTMPKRSIALTSITANHTQALPLSPVSGEGFATGKNEKVYTTSLVPVTVTENSASQAPPSKPLKISLKRNITTFLKVMPSALATPF